ncbi:MAG: uncharacterized lipoprotein YehR (DUF1307 family) [Oleispira sp.]|jgi:uncharacterized lipoprotein YehR (DUF1307 family)
MTMIKLIFSLMVSSIAAILLTGCGGSSSSNAQQLTKAQGEGSPIVATEMNMPSKSAVVKRLKENQIYIEAVKNLWW